MVSSAYLTLLISLLAILIPACASSCLAFPMMYFSILALRTPWTVHAWSLSHIRLFTNPWTVADQAPLSTGILQARILEWVAMPSSRESSQPRDQTQISYTAGRFFTSQATREAPLSLSNYISPSLSDLLQSVWQFLGPSTLLQMALFHSF